MLKRKAEKELLSWYENRKNKSLLVDGARQVGKTFIVCAFGREHAESFIELNLLKNPDLKGIFAGSLDADTILREVRLFKPETQIIEGKTILFIDEIQECPAAITALKFLAQDERVAVIASGSSLGIRYKGEKASFPAGYVQFLNMYPLDFEEFLWAKGLDDDIVNMLREHLRNMTSFPEAIHSKMMEYLTEYLVIGGMPEVVSAYVESRDVTTADRLQRDLYQSYLADIAIYAEPEVRIKAEKCYTSIARQLVKENHKFQYKAVERGGSARKYETSLDWLAASKMVIPVMNVTTPEYPTEAFEIDKNLRIYHNDIGFLLSQYGLELKQALLQESTMEGESMNLVLKTAKGGIYETLAAQMLKSTGIKQLHFYKSEDSTVEMEFLLENSDGVIPIDVKAGRNKSRSLARLLERDDIRYGYKFCSQNLGVSGKLRTAPLYLLPFIREI